MLDQLLGLFVILIMQFSYYLVNVSKSCYANNLSGILVSEFKKI